MFHHLKFGILFCCCDSVKNNHRDIVLSQNININIYLMWTHFDNIYWWLLSCYYKFDFFEFLFGFMWVNFGRAKLFEHFRRDSS